MKTKSLVIAALFAAAPVEARHHQSLKQSLGQTQDDFFDNIDKYYGQDDVS